MTRTQQVNHTPVEAKTLLRVHEFKRIGSSRGGKRREKLKTVDDNISKGSIRRIARRAGVKRICSLVYEDVRNALKSWLTDVIRDCALIAENGRRYTVTPCDVVLSLKRRGTTLWGFGDSHAFLHLDKKKYKPISQQQIEIMIEGIEKRLEFIADKVTQPLHQLSSSAITPLLVNSAPHNFHCRSSVSSLHHLSQRTKANTSSSEPMMEVPTNVSQTLTPSKNTTFARNIECSMPIKQTLIVVATNTPKAANKGKSPCSDTHSSRSTESRPILKSHLPDSRSSRTILDWIQKSSNGQDSPARTSNSSKPHSRRSHEEPVPQTVPSPETVPCIALPTARPATSSTTDFFDGDLSQAREPASSQVTSTSSYASSNGSTLEAVGPSQTRHSSHFESTYPDALSQVSSALSHSSLGANMMDQHSNRGTDHRFVNLQLAPSNGAQPPPLPMQLTDRDHPSHSALPTSSTAKMDSISPQVLRQVLGALRKLLDAEPGLTWIPRVISDVAVLCPDVEPSLVTASIRLFAEEATATAAAAAILQSPLKPRPAAFGSDSNTFWIPSLMIDEDNETFYLFQPDLI